MKNSCFALIAFILSGVGRVAFSQELLTNNGFESHTTSGWPADYWDFLNIGNPVKTFSSDALNSRGGTYCQKVIVNAVGGGVIFKQNLTFQKSRIYTGGIWLKSPDNVRVKFMFRRVAMYYEACASRFIEVGPEWKYYTLTGGFASDVPGFFGIDFESTGTLYMDDASLVDVTSTYSVQPVNDLGPIPSTLFGMHILQINGHKIVPQLNFGIVRLWDVAGQWINVEPNNNEWNFYHLDTQLDKFDSSDSEFNFLYTFGYPPTWAGSNGINSTDDFRDYVRTLATRYKGRIKYYEVWNETNLPHYWTGSIAQMVEMTMIAYEELKAIDPEIKVLAPNFSRLGLEWFDEFLSSGGANYFDIVSCHLYLSGTPEDDIPFIVGIKDIMATYHLEKLPIWNTEGNTGIFLHTPASESDNTGAVFNEDDAVAATSRAFIIQWLQGIKNFSWYTYEITGTNRANLISPPNYTTLLSPAISYRETANWLIDAEVVSKTIQGSTWIIELRRGDHYRAWMLWDLVQTPNFSIPAGWQVTTKRELDGNATNLTGVTNVMLGKKPILLERLNPIASFTLVDNSSNLPITGFENITKDITINASALPTSIRVQANLSASFNVGSIQFNVQGSSSVDNAASYQSQAWTKNAGVVKITGTPYTGSSASGQSGLSRTITIKLIDENTGYVTLEKWENLAGTSVSTLTGNPRFPDYPDAIANLTSFESPSNNGDSFGSRIRGYVIPPVTGTYKFSMTCNDACELWFSETGDPKDKVLISYSNVPATSVESGNRTLTVDQVYYVEAIHKENTSTDALSVGWQHIESGFTETPIPASRLSPYLEVPPTEPTGTITRERWDNIAGASIADLKSTYQYIHYYPSHTSSVSSFESPLNEGENFGSRIRGYVIPPVTGNYTFWVCGDNATELLLSSSNDPAGAVRIAYSDGYTGPSEWNKYGSQQSASVFLVSGRKYYIEANHKEANLTDYIGVGWALPNGTLERPIPGMRLIPFRNITTCKPEGTLLREQWNSISGATVADLTSNTNYPNRPTFSHFVRSFESPLNINDNMGSRIRGFLCAPETGYYTFWVAADNAAELWLSKTNQPDAITKVAHTDYYTGPSQWTKYASQQSAPIFLIQGKKYYVDFRHKEATLTDYAGVGWTLPSGTIERPLGNYISSLDTDISGNFSGRMGQTNKGKIALLSLEPSTETEFDCYPNPFNSETSIVYTLPKDTQVRLTIHDAFGRQISNLVDARQSAGTFSTIFRKPGKASSLLFCRLQTDYFVKTIKLLVVE